jgi:hypothetical protein
MNPLVARITSAKRKRLFGPKPIFEPYQPASVNDPADIERRLSCPLPAGLRNWLLEAGYGDFNEVLALRSESFRPVEAGQLKGHVLFAEDILGNFYCFAPGGGGIHFICRSAPEYAFMANDFTSFLEELERRAFQLERWVDGLPLVPYDWAPNPSIERTA